MSTSVSTPPIPDRRYPIGRFVRPELISSDDLHDAMCEIEHLPAHLRQAIAGLDEQQLDTGYRPGGWKIRQVVHHLADSHMNAYVRLRLAFTEPNPVIKPYKEAAWAELPDAASSPVDSSLSILTGLHKRWASMLRSMSASDWKKTYQHPEFPGRDFPLDVMTLLYGWHCRHHLAHISSARAANGW